MSEDRKKPGVAFWATVIVVVVLVAYPLSFGPVGWFYRTIGCPYWMRVAISAASRPVWRTIDNSPEPIASWIADAYHEYLGWWQEPSSNK
jgi:hypothetical protein